MLIQLLLYFYYLRRQYRTVTTTKFIYQISMAARWIIVDCKKDEM